MKAEPQVMLVALLGITPEHTRDARARAWALIWDYHAKKNPAAGPSERGNNDGTAKEDSADVSIVPD